MQVHYRASAFLCDCIVRATALGALCAGVLAAEIAEAELMLERRVAPGAFTQFRETLTVTLTFDSQAPLDLLSLLVNESIPAGWELGSTVRADGVLLFKPTPGAADALEWVWLTPPDSLPAELVYTLEVPPGGNASQSVTGSGIYDAGSGTEEFGSVETIIPFDSNADPVASCVSEVLSVELNESGIAMLVADDVDGGSVDPEGAELVRALSQQAFDCSDVGAPVRVTLTVADDVGQSDSCEATVAVVDVTPPVMSLVGNANVTLLCGAVYDDPGATAADGCAESPSVSVSGDVDLLANGPSPGVYTVRYTATDGFNLTSVERTVTVLDDTPPTLTLLGPDSMTAECGETYVDPGGVAVDACEGDISHSIAVDTSLLDEAAAGTYPVTLSVADTSGNRIEAIRLVTVVDTTPPTLILGGQDPVTIECGADYVDAGLAAVDACDNLLSHVVDDSAVNTAVPGSYTVAMRATDDAGNVAVASRTVVVVDRSAPVLRLVGPAEMTVDCGDPFVDPGAIVADLCDDDLSGSVVVGGDNVDTNPLTSSGAVFVLTYDVTDSAGNAADRLSRVVIVSGESCTPNQVYVSPNGSDAHGLGTMGSPWATIQFAIDSAAVYASEERPMTVNVGPGRYRESVTLAPYVTVRGANPNEAAATVLSPDATALEVAGRVAVLGAENAGVRELRIELPIDAGFGAELLRIVDVSMMVSNVEFSGANAAAAIGVRISGRGSSGTVVRRCLFARLATGILSIESHVNVTQNQFVDIGGHAVYVGAPGKGTPTTPLLGDATRPLTTGFNEFATVDGKFVESDDPSEILAENNAWGKLTEPEAIGAKISGAVDIEPLIPLGETHAADGDGDFVVGFSELLRVVQLFNAGRFHCDDGTEDGYAPGAGVEVCIAHDSDYAPRDFVVGLNELLRAIQLFNSGGYGRCDSGEDGFCVGGAVAAMAREDDGG